MLEILGILGLCNLNKKNAVARGQQPGKYVWFTIGLWLGLEFVGAMIGVIAQMRFFGAYLVALVFAAIGAYLSYRLAKGDAASFTPQPELLPGVQPLQPAPVAAPAVMVEPEPQPTPVAAPPVMVEPEPQPIPVAAPPIMMEPEPQPALVAAPPVAAAAEPSPVIEPKSQAVLRFCPDCGQPRAQGAKFCQRCGYSFVAVEAGSSAVPAVPVPEPKQAGSALQPQEQPAVSKPMDKSGSYAAAIIMTPPEVQPEAEPVKQPEPLSPDGMTASELIDFMAADGGVKAGLGDTGNTLAQKLKEGFYERPQDVEKAIRTFGDEGMVSRFHMIKNTMTPDDLGYLLPDLLAQYAKRKAE